jgi:16S rRNA (guanine1516-N2)-methyltransferase
MASGFAVSLLTVFQNVKTPEAFKKAQQWQKFLSENNFEFEQIEKIDMSGAVPVIYDKKNNKFSIDFVNDKKNYHKKKLSIKNEILSKALGAGKTGLKVLDLSAGLATDAVFLAQLGYDIVAVERNPLIYLCLEDALKFLKAHEEASNESTDARLKLRFHFADAQSFLKNKNFEADVIYFDPMFPEKAKSALPRQEMVFFKGLVGADDDAANVLQAALKAKVKRVVVKRPVKAPVLGEKPSGSLKGKLVRFDIYGVEK